MEALINKFSPVLYFHSNEKYFPCSIDWLLKYSTLIDFNTNTRIYNPTQQDLYDISKKYDFKRVGEGEVVLSFGEEVYRGQQPLTDVPCYVLYRELNNKLYITYIFVYPFNGSYEIAGLVGVGQHPGDIEHMTVECTKDGTLERVFFGAHGTKDGKWVNVNDVEFEDGHIVSYVAYSGHGLYNKSGEVFRFGGFANDHLEKGIRWQPKSSIIYNKDDPKFNVATMGWTAFNCRFGGASDKPNTDGIMGLPDKPWFVNGDNVDASFYAPPRIITEKYVGKYKFITDFLILSIIYTVILSVKYLSQTFIFDKYTTNFFLKHLIVILIILILYYSYSKLGKSLLLKLIPS
jgi:hypothetical protein